MIRAIFKQKKDDKKLIGYSTIDYKSNDDNEIVKLISESELNGLIPESFDETDWKNVRRHYKLDDSGNIVFDEGYEPKNEER